MYIPGLRVFQSNSNKNIGKGHTPPRLYTVMKEWMGAVYLIDVIEHVEVTGLKCPYHSTMDSKDNIHAIDKNIWDKRHTLQHVGMWESLQFT